MHAPATASETRALFRKRFEALPVALAHGPGSLTLMGDGADRFEGLAVTMAMPGGAWVAAGHRNDGRVQIASSHFREDTQFFIDRFETSADEGWAAHPKAVLAEALRRGANCTGLNLLIHSNLPMRRGYGSSAAVSVATLLALRHLFSLRFPPKSKGVTVPEEERDLPQTHIKIPERIELARLCVEAGRLAAASGEGLLQPMTALCGRRGSLLVLDFMHESVSQMPMPAGYVMVAAEVLNEGLPTFADEGLTRQDAISAAAVLGVSSLRKVDPEMVESRKHLFSGAELAVARHLANENRRVVAAERALSHGDPVRLGECLSLGHLSQSELLKNSTHKLDKVVAIAKSLPGCLGAGVTGRSGGRVILSLVQHELAADFMSLLSGQAEESAGVSLRPFVCIPADGGSIED